MPDTAFHTLLAGQVRHEFTAAQQYLAIAVYFDGADLPQLAAFFYQHADEERQHAMMIVRYLLDRGIPVQIPGVNDVRNEFDGIRDAVRAALESEQTVTGQITDLAAAARAEMDFLGEEFMSWFLKEQVEEVATMSTLLKVVDRANGNLFDIEDFVSREMGAGTADATAPETAGGA
ncbi:ferritin [Mycolicibacterium brumae]|uniref:Ferritin n=1 Tax=Mycolicibacterium brumae TaxID=85968 RepID=A0A2G5PDD2_9MYCO|nr:ferritin [Mycolicibacterium brumae]MCV7191772.1 ferritin [Mycolicibacterium brumae]PIB76341.1 bacterioferritin [Mycolicibacterium brumae]RWA15852.1 hypothetical protein MBRU_09895 [Mycolicibacterium brumae DSM 44177]UWW07078.1 ferritin [Mycolicibacterium brumae]